MSSLPSLPRVRLDLGTGGASSSSTYSSRSPSLLERRGSGSALRVSVSSSRSEPKDGIPTFALRTSSTATTPTPATPSLSSASPTPAAPAPILTASPTPPSYTPAAAAHTPAADIDMDMDEAIVADALRSCPTDKLSSILKRLCVEDSNFSARLHTAMQGGDSVRISNTQQHTSRASAHAHFAAAAATGYNSASSTPNAYAYAHAQQRGSNQSYSHPRPHPQAHAAHTPTSPRNVRQIDGQSQFVDHELKYRNGGVGNGVGNGYAHHPHQRPRPQKSSRRRMMPGRAVTSYVGKSSSPRGFHAHRPPTSSSPRQQGGHAAFFPSSSPPPPRGANGADDYYGSNPLSVHTAPATRYVVPSARAASMSVSSGASEAPTTPAHIAKLNNYGAPISPTYSPRGSNEDTSTPAPRDRGRRRGSAKAASPRTRPRSTSPPRWSRVHDVRTFFEEQAAISEQQKQREIALRQLSPRRSLTLQRRNTYMPTYRYDQKTRMRLIQSPPSPGSERDPRQSEGSKTMPRGSGGRPSPPSRGRSVGSLFSNDGERDPSASSLPSSPRAAASASSPSPALSPRAKRSMSTNKQLPPSALDAPPRRKISAEAESVKRPSMDNLRAASTPSLAPRLDMSAPGAGAGATILVPPQMTPIADDRVTRERERARSPIGRIARGRRTRGVDNDDEPYDLMRLISPMTASASSSSASASMASRSRTTSPGPHTRHRSATTGGAPAVAMSPTTATLSSVPLSQRKGPRPFSPPPPGMVIPYARSPPLGGRSSGGSTTNGNGGNGHFHHRSSSPSTSTSISKLGLPSFERPESPNSTHPRPVSSPSVRSESRGGSGRHASLGSDSYSMREYVAESASPTRARTSSRLTRRSSSSHFRTRSISPTRRGADDYEPSYSMESSSHYSARSPSRTDRFSRAHRISSPSADKFVVAAKDAPSSSSSSGKRKFKMKRPRFFQKDNDSDKLEKERERQEREQHKRRGSFSLSRSRRGSVSVSRSRSVASPQAGTAASPAERALEEEALPRLDKESFFRSPFSDRKKHTPMSNPASPSHRKHSSAHDASSFMPRGGEARSMHASRNRSRRFSLFSFKRIGGAKDAAAAAAAHEAANGVHNADYPKSSSIFARKDTKSNASEVGGGLRSRSRSPSRSMSRPPLGDFTSSSRFKKYNRQMGVHDVLAGQLTSLLKRTPSVIHRERLQRFVETLEQESSEKGGGSVRDRSVSSPHHSAVPHSVGVGSVSRSSNSYERSMSPSASGSGLVPESATAKIVRRHSRLPFDRVNRHEQAFDWFVNEPVARRHFGAFLRKQHADENLLFSTECSEYAAITNDDERHARFIKIWKLYVAQGALRQVNLSAEHANGLRDIYEGCEAGEVPPADAFSRTHRSILRLIRLPFLEYLKSDDYHNYVKVTNRHHSYTSQTGLKQVTWDDVQKMIHGASLPKLLERDPSLYGEYLLEQGVPMKNVIQIVSQAKKSIVVAKSPSPSGRSSPTLAEMSSSPSGRMGLAGIVSVGSAGGLSSLPSSPSSASNAASSPSSVATFEAAAVPVSAASAKEQHQRYLSSKQAAGQRPQISRSGTFVMLPGELGEEPDIDDDWLFERSASS